MGAAPRHIADMRIEAMVESRLVHRALHPSPSDNAIAFPSRKTWNSGRRDREI